jgi:hypothetical protein
MHGAERVGFEQLAKELNGVPTSRRGLVFESANGEVGDEGALLGELGGETTISGY